MLSCIANGANVGDRVTGSAVGAAVGGQEMVGDAVGARVCPWGVGMALIVGNGEGTSLGFEVGGMQMMSPKHMKSLGQSLPELPYAVFAPWAFLHSVCGEQVALAMAYPPTRFGPQKWTWPGVRLSQSRAVGCAVVKVAVSEGVGAGVETVCAEVGFKVVGGVLGFRVGDAVAGFVAGNAGFVADKFAAAGGEEGFVVGSSVGRAVTPVATPPPQLQQWSRATPIPPSPSLPSSAHVSGVL